MAEDITTAALEYHARKPAGKISIVPTKPCNNQQELSLAYTPGVAKACLAIKEKPEDVFKYTNKANMVAIISDGTAILGLGNIGPEAGLPVMEGKSVLFKKFADIDAFPLCLSFKHIEDEKARLEAFYNTVRSLEPTLGGINLEDIAAPFCFELQAKTDADMDIPVFHDDQYGTAIIITAGLKNALKIVNKKLENLKIVFNGAGAAGIACAKLLLKTGVKKENIFMCDSKGLILESRKDLNEYKMEFAQKGYSLGLNSEGPVGLDQVLQGADVFVGVSVAGALKPELVKKMADNSLVFALANPVPEIMPDEALQAGARIVATGRSDFPNQLNNVLGYPGIFRGALDTRSLTINDEMKLAAAEAIASLASEKPEGKIRELLERAYPEEAKAGLFSKENPFGEKYIVPRLFDLRVVPRVARSVAKYAMETGVARVRIADLDEYEKWVLERIMKNW